MYIVRRYLNNSLMITLLLYYNIGPGLILSVHAALCDPAIAPCNVGSCMPCNLRKNQPVEQDDDCTNPNGCPEVTMVKIEPPVPDFSTMRRPPFIQPPTTCLFCFWNMNGFYWYNKI